MPTTLSKPKRLTPHPKKVEGTKPICWAVDTETTGLDIRHGCRPFYVSACSSEGKILTWEWDVDPLTRNPIVPGKDRKEVAQFLTGIDLVFHHTKYDLLALELSNLWPTKNFPNWPRIDDTVIASHLLDSASSHNLKDLGERYLGISTDDEKELKEAVTEARKIAKRQYPTWRIAGLGNPHTPSLKRAPKAGWGVMDYWLPRAIAKAEGYPKDHPFWAVLSRYATQDAERTIALWLLFQKLMEEQEAQGIIPYRKIYNTRRRLLQITYGMERNGVTLSRARLDRAVTEFKEIALHSQRMAFALADNQIENLASGKQLQTLLYSIFQVPVIKETKTGYATDETTLKTIQSNLKPSSVPYQFIKHLLASRQNFKAVDYLESYVLASHPRYLILPGKTTAKALWLVIHPSFNITGTATTRLSSSDPNAQNISNKNERNLREVFGPLPGRVWYAMDYKNIELRIPAYEAKETELIELFEKGGSYHLLVASVLYPELFKKLGPDKFGKRDEYKAVKSGNFASQYGCGEEKGDNTYGIKGAWSKLRNRFSNITNLANHCVEHAVEHGYVLTIGRYPLQVPVNEWGRIRPTTPFNYHTQGSAGEAIILAMIRVFDYLETLDPEYRMILTIHDELVFDFPNHPDNPKHVRKIKQLMEQSGEDLGLPTPVDIECIKTSWDQGEDLKL